VKVRITTKPRVHEVDGVSLVGLLPGAVRDISASIATWLIAERYAVPEMRGDVHVDSDDDYSGFVAETRRLNSTNCPRRRAHDR
jgi:hypothetical protein